MRVAKPTTTVVVADPMLSIGIGRKAEKGEKRHIAKTIVADRRPPELGTAFL